MSYLLDIFLFSPEDLALNSAVLMWPSKINPIFDENDEVSIFFRMYFCILTFFFLFRDIPVAYGSSQARGRIRAAAAGPTPQTQQLGI